MPINPDAVGTESRAAPRRRGRRRTRCSTPSASAPGVDELAFTTENTNGVRSRCSRRSPCDRLGHGRRRDRAASARSTRRCSCTASRRSTLHQPIPVEGTIRTVEQDHRHLRQGQGRASSSPRRSPPTSTDGEPHVHDAHVGVHPRRRRLGRRPRPVGPAATCRPSARPTTASPTRRRPTRRWSTGCRATATRCTPIRRSRRWAASTRPILHGLCTYGFTGRALLHSLCGGDPARFTAMEGRFSSPVFPGDSLTVNMWVDGDGQAVYRDEAQWLRRRERSRRHRPGRVHLQLTGVRTA